MIMMKGPFSKMTMFGLLLFTSIGIAKPTVVDHVYQQVGVFKRPVSYCANDVQKYDFKKWPEAQELLKNLNSKGLGEALLKAAVTTGVCISTGVVGCVAWATIPEWTQHRQYKSDKKRDEAILDSAKQICKEMSQDPNDLLVFNDFNYQACLHIAQGANKDIIENHGTEVERVDEQGQVKTYTLIYPGHFPVQKEDILTYWELHEKGQKVGAEKRLKSFSYGQKALRQLDTYHQYCLSDDESLDQLRKQHFTLRSAVEHFVSLKNKQKNPAPSDKINPDGYELKNREDFRRVIDGYSYFYPEYMSEKYYVVSRFENQIKQSLFGDVFRYSNTAINTETPQCKMKDFSIKLPMNDISNELLENALVRFTLKIRDEIHEAETRAQLLEYGDIYQHNYNYFLYSITHFNLQLENGEVYKIKFEKSKARKKIMVKSIQHLNNEGAILSFCEVANDANPIFKSFKPAH